MKLAQFLLYILQRFVGGACRCSAARLFFGGALFILAFDTAILDFWKLSLLHIQAAFERGYLVGNRQSRLFLFFARAKEL